ncbi:hypothetical protein QJ850_gp076 [Acanthamoeba polyphaga mimivirus]|uniref:Uncharacterized protein n=1 Tax=Acanthamoeba polyphaga mimivirus Kroon TaxID=3069720 RepID=A0A0G2Y492_9VIRU|nr:hypothetical protein QJ850_gp076 [Acanthamoeba polyphaga mimivirus]AKI80623.1 hypothetical protein [Acanthamoeba polyphaga mimivirus Kroon]
MINIFLTPIPDSPMNLLTIGTGMIGIISGILFVKGFTFFNKRYNKNNTDECLPLFIGGLLGGIIGIATGFSLTIIIAITLTIKSIIHCIRSQ